MEIKYEDIVKDLFELDVAVAQAYAMTEAQLGIKIDGITDFIMKFIYTENLNNRDVTISPNTPNTCLLYTSPSPRDGLLSRMPSSA